MSTAPETGAAGGCGHPNHGAADHDCAPFRKRVSMEELKAIWFGDGAVGLTIDEQNGLKVVTMNDGTEYEAVLP